MTTTTANLRHAIANCLGGGPNHYDTMSKRLGYYYTHGCSILIENGCHWLISDMIIKMGLDPKCKGRTHTVKFVPNKNGGGRVNYYTTDDNTGDSVKIAHQDYSMVSIDFPITFFIGETLSNEGNIINLLMISSEY